MTKQPPCGRGGGDGGSGGEGGFSGEAHGSGDPWESYESYADVPGLAAWLMDTLSPEELAAAVVEFADTPAGCDLAELLLGLE